MYTIIFIRLQLYSVITRVFSSKVENEVEKQESKVSHDDGVGWGTLFICCFEG